MHKREAQGKHMPYVVCAHQKLQHMHMPYLVPAHQKHQHLYVQHIVFDMQHIVFDEGIGNGHEANASQRVASGYSLCSHQA